MTSYQQNSVIFVSYAHKDNESTDPSKRWLDRLLEHLEPLIQQHQLKVWSDRDIETGDDWHQRIQIALNDAKAAVLLISPAFLASKYIRNSELPVLLKKAKDNGVRILPLIVRPSLFYETKFKYPDPLDGPEEFLLSSLQTANPPDVPLNNMSEYEQDKILLSVARNILRIVEQPQVASELTKGASQSALSNDNSRFQSVRVASAHTYLEDHIREGYQFISTFEKKFHSTSVTDNEPMEVLVKRYKEVLKYYLRIYLAACKKTNTAPKTDIVGIADTIGDVYVGGIIRDLTDTSPSEVYTNLVGSRIIQVGVTQIFRIADLLTRPESVKARKLYEAVTKNEKMRRTLNRRNDSIKLGKLGNLKLVTTNLDEYDRFWKPARTDLRLATNQPLSFIPYELSLSQHLQNLKSEFDSVLESALLSTSESIVNSQIAGRLRIYAPGTGVISLGITLEFKESVHIELVAQIAHNIEELLFVDPDGLRKPCHKLILEIVDDVISHLFKREGISYEERRWLPPTTTISFRDDHGLDPQAAINELTYLMSLAPGNKENIQYLRRRLQKVLNSLHWKRERVMAAAGQGVALFFIGDLYAAGNKARRKNLLYWLTETHEMISAAAYAEQAFAEEIDKIYSQQLLDSSWSPEQNTNFEYLFSLLSTMRQVMQAIASIKIHLNKQGAGFLIDFSNDVWNYSSPVDVGRLSAGLLYIADWLSDLSSKTSDQRINLLEGILRDVHGISLPFGDLNKSVLTGQALPLQEELEARLLTELQEIEVILKKDNQEELHEMDGKFEVIRQLRRHLRL